MMMVRMSGSEWLHAHYCNYASACISVEREHATLGTDRGKKMHHTPYTMHPGRPELAEASRPRTVELAAQALKQLVLQSTYPEYLVPNQPNNKSSAEHSRAHSSKRFRSLIRTYLGADHHESLEFAMVEDMLQCVGVRYGTAASEVRAVSGVHFHGVCFACLRTVWVGGCVSCECARGRL